MSLIQAQQGSSTQVQPQVSQPRRQKTMSLLKAAEKVRAQGELELFAAEVQGRVLERRLEAAGDLAITAQALLERQAVLSIHAQRGLGRAVLDAAGESGSVTAEGLCGTLNAFQRATNDIMQRFGQGAGKAVTDMLR